MIDIQFDHVRSLLLDPSKEASEVRNGLRVVCFGVKIAAGAFAASCTLTAVTGLISSVAAPILGSIVVLWSAAGAVLGREVFVVSENAENILRDDGVVQNYLNRIGNSLTPDWFISSLFKNTWVAAPLLSSFFIEQLNMPKSA
ncbi:MAG: hypothetical protein V4489_08970 [Chlamydiota bacterium]